MLFAELRRIMRLSLASLHLQGDRPPVTEADTAHRPDLGGGDTDAYISANANSSAFSLGLQRVKSYPRISLP